jgi:hypothetical protein
MVGSRGARIILPKKFKKKIPAKKRMGPICDLRDDTSNSLALAEFWRGEIPSTYRAPYLARIFDELLSRDHEDGRATWQPQGVGSEAYLNGTSQGPTPEDAGKDDHICGRSK